MRKTDAFADLGHRMGAPASEVRQYYRALREGGYIAESAPGAAVTPPTEAELRALVLGYLASSAGTRAAERLRPLLAAPRTTLDVWDPERRPLPGFAEPQTFGEAFAHAVDDVHGGPAGARWSDWARLDRARVAGSLRVEVAVDHPFAAIVAERTRPEGDLDVPVARIVAAFGKPPEGDLRHTRSIGEITLHRIGELSDDVVDE